MATNSLRRSIAALALALPACVQVSERGTLARSFVVVFRAFDDGVAFRYELPKQRNLNAFLIADELTEFAMADNAKSTGAC